MTNQRSYSVIEYDSDDNIAKVTEFSTFDQANTYLIRNGWECVEDTAEKTFFYTFTEDGNLPCCHTYNATIAFNKGAIT